MRIDTIDLKFQGTPQVIAAYLLRGPTGPVLLEPGPGSTLPALIEGLAALGLQPGDIRDVLVTHIHLDHAGSAGWWAKQGSTVRVHPRGRRHLIDPSKLIASATMIYGNRMEILWGEILPAPEENVLAVEDGETFELGGLAITPIDTPGHARHHHVYAVEDVLFTGDAAGIRLPAHRWVDLPAPPPEFDLEAWKITLDRLRALEPRAIYRTHFAESTDVAAELDRLESLLEQAVGWIEADLARGDDRDAIVKAFEGRMREAAGAAELDAASVLAYELANPRVMSVDGILRYLKTRDRDSASG